MLQQSDQNQIVPLQYMVNVKPIHELILLNQLLLQLMDVLLETTRIYLMIQLLISGSVMEKMVELKIFVL